MVLKLALVVLALGFASACTPLEIAGDVAVGTARVAVGAADLVL